MKLLPILFLAPGFLLATLASGQTGPETANAIIYNRNGERIGAATFTVVRGAGVKIGLDVHGLPPGLHGLHIHSKGQCEPPEFDSAGPHFNPQHRQHGLRNPQGPHAGDLGNLQVGTNGQAHVVILDPRLSLASGNPNSILRPGGASLVIHAQPDDELSDPSGNSGKRIACGVISIIR
ncbi:MAG TPA: superoxide dismutase family protein [Terriglobia bacterium]|nr:superoxide dismutase family protein [Terriglobia bacterium]